MKYIDIIKHMIGGTVIAILSVSASTVFSAEAESSLFTFSGNIRGGYYTAHRSDRDDTHNVTDEFRARIRLGAGIQLSERVQVKARFAGRYSTIQDGTFFSIDDHVPATDGLRRGDSTIDQLYAKFTPDPRWQVKLGRMQTKMELKGVAKKSLDRNDSPNVDITWTDGVHVIYKADAGWRGHVVLQHNAKDGATTVRRKPFNFSDDNSRVTYFFAWENNQPWGPVVQRGIDLTYTPDALQVDGSSAGRIDDMLNLVVRGAAQWSVGDNGIKFLLGGEVGYAFNTQTHVTAKTGTSGDVSGAALQLSANFMDIIPRHSFGIVYGHVESGWLLSPDFRNNNTLIEGRYLWKRNKKEKLEIRLREREDLDPLVGASRKRTDVDLYARYTWKF
jgi:hypothetical protein